MFPSFNEECTLTTADTTGREGPTKQKILKFYNIGFMENSRWFDVSRRGFQTITIFKSGVYIITAYGAGGKSKIGLGLFENYVKSCFETKLQINFQSFQGAIISGKFQLETNTKITIAVGQMGRDTTAGSGGTFVVNEDSKKILVVAGGAGGFLEGDKDKIRNFNFWI